MLVQSEVTQQHGTRENHCTGVGLVLALDIKTDVTAAGLKDSNITAHVAARHQTRAADERSTDVGENATVEVRHDHHVKLLRARDGLHGGVVHNHIIHLQGGVVLSGLVESAAEKTVGKFHDVGLVDASNLLPVVGECEAESKLGNALGLGAGDDFERLDHALDRLVLQARILALGVLTDDAKINILVTSLVAGDVLDQGDGGVDVQFLAKGDVEGLVARPLDRGEKDTLQPQLVALEGREGFLEQFLRMLVSSVDTTHIHLLPLNGDVVGLEDSLDRLGDFGTNSIT